MATTNTTLAEQVIAANQRALLLADSLDRFAGAIHPGTRRSESQIEAGMAALAHSGAESLSAETGRVLAQARVTGPIAERVPGVGQVAAPTAVEWVHEYARQVRTVIVDEFCGDRWWPSEWEFMGAEYQWEIEYAKNNPPAALLLAWREDISPLFRWWRQRGPKLKAEIEWEARRAIEHVERWQERSWLSGMSGITFGNWTTPRIVSEPLRAFPSETQGEQATPTRGPEEHNIEPYKVLAAYFTSKTTAGKIADQVESNRPLREKLLSAGADLSSRKEITRLAGNFLLWLRRRERLERSRRLKRGDTP